MTELVADYQEFRTHTGERATGFQRMLQIDLAGGAIAVDTFSLRLDAAYSSDYDYRQFVADTGNPNTPSNVRPWRIVEAGLQGRYTEMDDEFVAAATFQYPKSVETLGVRVLAPTPAATGIRAAEQGRVQRPIDRSMNRFVAISAGSRSPGTAMSSSSHAGTTSSSSSRTWPMSMSPIASSRPLPAKRSFFIVSSP